jgi:2'-5' RNA ligase
VKSAYLNDAYRRVWDAFRALERTDDGRHDTEQWRAHDSPFIASIVRVKDTDLSPGLPLLNNALASLQGTRVHPGHFLHIMLQEVGFVVREPGKKDEISDVRLEEFIMAAVEPVSAIEQFTISLGGANAFSDAVFLEIGDGAPLAQLHARLFELAALPVHPDYPYLPHCTVAHFDGTCSPQAATSVIAPWRDERFGAMVVSEVEIVRLDPQRTYPELETLAVIPLGA